MKVALLFLCLDTPGGVQRRLVRVYNEICKENPKVSCDVIFVGGKSKDTTREVLKKIDCPLENINIVNINHKLLCLFYFLFNNKYELVHLWNRGKLRTMLQIICRITGKKILYTICNYIEAYNLESEFENATKHEKKALRRADCVDLLYPAAEGYISKYAEGKLYITPGTFTNLNVFRPEKKKRIMVYAAARLNDDKDPKLLLRAVSLCQDEIRGYGYRIIILGKGIHEAYMKSYILENKLSDIIEMPGYQKTSEYLPSAEVFFSLQKRENYPSQSLAEAIACGCYSIITDVGDSRRMANDSFADFVEGEEHSVARAIIQYMGMNEEKKKSIISAARQFALQNFSIEKSKKYYLSLIEELCK